MGYRLDKCGYCEEDYGYKNLYKCVECGERFCENCISEDLCGECENFQQEVHDREQYECSIM